VCVFGLVMVGCQQPDSTQSTRIETGFLNREVTGPDTVHRYQVYLPHEYTEERDWPVIVFLHGAGERGTDGLFQTQVGLGSAIRRHPERFPAIAIFPQLPPGEAWNPSTEFIALSAMDQTLREFAVDRDRFILTGLSMGGHGSLFLGTRYPELFAAIAPICPTVGDTIKYPYLGGNGYDDAIEAAAGALSNTSVWLFHGEEDRVFSAQISRDLSAAIEAAGGTVQYTEFEGVGHNSWDPAYAMPEFIDWMLSAQRP